MLQTFLSLKKADEMQIQGRTARQGKQGTYSLVLLQKDLVDNFKLSGSTTSSVAQRDMCSTLDCARSAVQLIACNETETALADATSIAPPNRPPRRLVAPPGFRFSPAIFCSALAAKRL